MSGHRPWADTKELRKGLDLRLAVFGDHFMQFELGGGAPLKGQASWSCRDCGLQTSLTDEQKQAWRDWITWCITAPIHLVEVAQERSHCGGV